MTTDYERAHAESQREMRDRCEAIAVEHDSKTWGLAARKIAEAIRTLPLTPAAEPTTQSTDGLTPPDPALLAALLEWAVNSWSGINSSENGICLFCRVETDYDGENETCDHVPDCLHIRAVAALATGTAGAGGEGDEAEQRNELRMRGEGYGQ